MNNWRKDKPCTTHELAFSNRSTPEFIGMRESGVKFKRCFYCGWWIKKPRDCFILKLKRSNSPKKMDFCSKCGKPTWRYKGEEVSICKKCKEETPSANI
jgi:hypothetical protein